MRWWLIHHLWNGISCANGTKEKVAKEEREVIKRGTGNLDGQWKSMWCCSRRLLWNGTTFGVGAKLIEVCYAISCWNPFKNRYTSYAVDKKSSSFPWDYFTFSSWYLQLKSLQTMNYLTLVNTPTLTLDNPNPWLVSMHCEATRLSFVAFLSGHQNLETPCTTGPLICLKCCDRTHTKYNTCLNHHFWHCTVSSSACFNFKAKDHEFQSSNSF